MLLIVHSKNLNSLSYFQTHEKRSTGPNSPSHFKAREKKTRKGLKKRSTGPNSLSHFHAREKKTRKGLFFNLRLRKASKPLRERV